MTLVEPKKSVELDHPGTSVDTRTDVDSSCLRAPSESALVEVLRGDHSYAGNSLQSAMQSGTVPLDIADVTEDVEQKPLPVLLMRKRVMLPRF